MRRAAVLALLVCLPARAAGPLAGHSADVASFSVSGLSSGGYMAIQMQVAHSSRVKGVGALAAGPYYCAQGSLWTANYNCMSPMAWTPVPPPETLKAHAERFAQEGRIDPTANLAAARVWLYSGTRDRTVERPVVDAAARFYTLHGVKNVPVLSRASGHAMVTMDAGGACGSTESPFITDCDYDAAGALLTHVLGVVKAPATNENGRLVLFDQRPFSGGSAYALSLADTGYAYIPSSCATDSCTVHVAFHGCKQGATDVGEHFVREAGYNRWADTNRLIILYPQAIARYGFGYGDGHWTYTYNPRGCWDWWGYTDAQYATKSGAQIRAVMAMVDRLGAPRK